jgi:hypothetical protein
VQRLGWCGAWLRFGWTRQLPQAWVPGADVRRRLDALLLPLAFNCRRCRRLQRRSLLHVGQFHACPCTHQALNGGAQKVAWASATMFKGAEECKACFSSALAAQVPLIANQGPRGCTFS